ncbi:hypothetical protein [Brevibacillus dissolubilis]|uniref:hypothetical protein n=1 Tax=Brevibacillus dissolubilis TaxID=1844116 RepID=UPI0011167E42|nr:hypothetical protein [Brevibacillus dissolubilis]
MKRRLIHVLLTVSLLATTWLPAGVTAQEVITEVKSTDSNPSDTKKWVIQQSNSDKEDKSQVTVGRQPLTEEQITNIHWDQLTTKEVQQIYKHFDRKSLQIASYFYSSLNRLLTDAELHEMYQWNDEDILKHMESLSPSQLQALVKYTPLIPNTQRNWKKEKEEREKRQKETKTALRTASQAQQSTDSVLANSTDTGTTKNLGGTLKYKEIDRPYLYTRQNTVEPVSDQFRDANLVENDLILEGPRDMDLVITRRYNSSQATTKEMGYYQSADDPTKYYNDTKKRRFANEWIPFPVGWTLNLPYFEYTDNVVVIDDAGSRFRQDETHHERWTIHLDDGTTLTYENGSFKDYPYPAELSFQMVDYSRSHFKVGKGGYVYEYRTYNEGKSLEVTKTNPYGDRITYRMHKDGSDITITDSLNRYIVLNNSTSYGIEELLVYENAASTYSPIKKIDYVTENVGGTLYEPEYLRLSAVIDGGSGKHLSEYSYYSYKRYGEFNYRTYYLNNPVSGFEDGTYVSEENDDLFTMEFDLLERVTYPQEGLSMRYQYSSYDDYYGFPLPKSQRERMDERGIVRLYQDEHALSYVSYHPVTDLVISYKPYGETMETMITKRYMTSDETGRRFWEVWKKPKSEIPRLQNASERFGDEIFSYEILPSNRPNTPDEPTVLKKYRVNTQGNNRLQYVRSKNIKKNTLTASNGTETYSYNPISYVSYAYVGDQTEPTYEFSFADSPIIPQATLNYLKNPTVTGYTDSVRNYAVVTKSTKGIFSSYKIRSRTCTSSNTIPRVTLRLS